MKQYTINDRIRAKEVRLIDETGAQVGIVSIETARSLADEKSLDLLLVSDTSSPPVCKIIDFGQFKYQQRKKEKASRKTVKQNTLKEIKMSPKISIHDFNVRVNRGLEFLGKGYKVKLTVPFRGREIMHLDLGYKIIERYIGELGDKGTPDGDVMRANRALTLIITPK